VVSSADLLIKIHDFLFSLILLTRSTRIIILYSYLPPPKTVFNYLARCNYRENLKFETSQLRLLQAPPQLENLQVVSETLMVIRSTVRRHTQARQQLQPGEPLLKELLVPSNRNNIKPVPVRAVLRSDE
jgi:hypothetical protein